MNINALVVDDSVMIRKMVIRTLEETSFKPSKILEAKDGVDALDRFLNATGINLILSDWNMPNMDGLTFVKKIRAKDKNVVIVMITTEGTMGKMEEALQHGVDNYVVKPFTPELLQRRLEAAFERVKNK